MWRTWGGHVEDMGRTCGGHAGGDGEEMVEERLEDRRRRIKEAMVKTGKLKYASLEDRESYICPVQ